MWLFNRKSSGLRWTLLLSTRLCLSLYCASSYNSAGMMAGMPSGMVLMLSFGCLAILPFGDSVTFTISQWFYSSASCGVGCGDCSYGMETSVQKRRHLGS